MIMNRQTLDFIKTCEGEVLKVYLDSAGLKTVGVGHLLIGDEKKMRVGQTITPEQSNAFLTADLADTVADIERLVKVPLTENQRTALISLVFNIGGGAFAGSSVLRKLNQGDCEKAATHFGDWVKARVNGKLTVLKGLVRRRATEKALFEK